MKKIIFMVLAAAMFVGCYKVDIYWSDHPKQGRLVLVTDWSKRTTGGPVAGTSGHRDFHQNKGRVSQSF